MTCNLAKSIAKASVTEQALIDLLNKNVAAVAENFKMRLQQVYADREITAYASRGKVTIEVDDIFLSVVNGRVVVNGQRGDMEAMRDVLQNADTILKNIADDLFRIEMTRLLKPKKTSTVKVQNGQSTEKATILHLEVGPINLRVFLLSGGNIQVFVDNGTFEQAERITRSLLTTLSAQGLEVKLGPGGVEQHKPDVPHVHVQVKQTHRR